MVKSFTKVETDFLELINSTSNITFNGKIIEIRRGFKPRPKKGECKTDIFILGTKGEQIKISIKKSNADFLENKMTYQRAQQLFSLNTDIILANSIEAIKDSFKKHPLVSYEKHNKTEAKTIVLGWKFELMNKGGGAKSGKMLGLTDSQKIDIYSGFSLDEGKRDAFLDGKSEKNSGIADYILVVDKVTEDLQFYIDRLQKICEFAPQQDIYFACKALNYRAEKNKWDGDRPLAVYIDWQVQDQELVGQVKLDSPLRQKGNQVGERLQQALKKLGITSHNFDDLMKHYKGVSYPSDQIVN